VQHNVHILLEGLYINKIRHSKCYTLVLFVIVTLILYSIPKIDLNYGEGNENVIKPSNLDLLAEWDLTGTPISILSESDWTWAVTQPWCSGGGSINNPYVIANVTINGLNTTSCINIIQTSSYFVIQNCTLFNASRIDTNAGIDLGEVNNGILLENNISYNNGPGINMIDCFKNTVIGNTIYDNTDSGINIIRSDNTTIFNNDIEDNYFGVYSRWNNYVNISSNEVNENRWGIQITEDSYDLVYDNDANENEYEGLVLEEANNNIIDFNRFFNNSRMGIWCYDCDANNFTDNTIWENDHNGFMIIDSDDNILSGNIVHNNTKDGIYVVGELNCIDNVVIGNTVYDNKANGITFESFSIEFTSLCTDNEIADNTLYNNTNYGLALYNCSSNIISENVIFENNVGIKLNASDANIFTKNTVYDNYDFGVLIDHPFYVNELNLFYENNFNNPLGSNAEDNGQNNLWDDGSIGNFWHDYAGDDINDDGIGDIPHNIPGTALSADTKPIYWDAPIITIESPTMDEFFSTSAPDFEISIIGNIEMMWYRLYDDSITTINTTFDELTGTISQDRWVEFSDGDVTVEYFANDTKGNCGVAEVTINKDTTIPVIAIELPIFGEFFATNPPDYNITITEINLEEIWFNLYDGTITTANTTITETVGTFEQAVWDLVGQGPIVITFYANDYGMNLATIQTTIQKDSIGPVITLNQPLEDQILGKTAPNYELTIDEAVDKIWYTINDEETETYILTLDGTIDQILWETLEAGEIKITFYANDTLGNIGSAQVNVTKEKSNLALIISLSVTIPVAVGIGVAVTIIIIRSRRIVPTG